MMMHPLCLKKVEEYIQKENDMVRNVILNLCMNISETLRLSDLEQPYQLPENKLPNDSRISYLVFNNFRTYPNLKTNYGVSFTNEKGPSSLLLVGQNGSGKSTLYTALEKIYLGYSSYAKQMSQSEDNYLTFGFATGETPKDKIWSLTYQLFGNHSDNVLTTKAPISSPIAVPAFFCSDVDIQKLKQKKELFFWILEQMGYVKLEEGLEKVRKMRQSLMNQKERSVSNSQFSSSEYQELLLALIQFDNSESENEEIETCKNKVEYSSPVFFSNFWEKIPPLSRSEKTSDNEQLQDEDSLIQKASEKNKKDVPNIDSNKLKALYNKFSDIVKNQDGGEKWKLAAISNLLDDKKFAEAQEMTTSGVAVEDIEVDLVLLDSVERAIKRIQIDLVKSFVETYGKSIIAIMEKFSNHNEKYNFVPEDDIENVKLEIYAHLKGDYKTIPHEYFNEFRFKLYCVAMKMTIAYDWMLRENCSLPIVLDDVFNANDFENSIKLEHFAYYMKNLYAKTVLAKDFQYHLQLIMTTHDDLVIYAFQRGYTGLAYCDFSQAEINKFPLIVGRLFRLDELDELEHYGDNNVVKEGSNNFRNIYRYVQRKY